MWGTSIVSSLGVTIGSHGSMLFLLSSFSFSPKQSGCPTGFYIHSTCLPYDLSFDFDVVGVSFLCLLMALVKHIVGYLLFLDAAFREVLDRKSPMKRFGILLSSRNALDCR